MTPEEEHLAFYSEIGLAIAQWAQVEMALCGAMRNCAPAKHHVMMQVGFFSIDNFRSKLQFADNLLSHKFGDNPAFNEWKAISGRLSALANKRNKLAHRAVTVFHHSRPGRRYALVPWLIESGNNKFRSRVPVPSSGDFCVRDIIGIRFEFFAIGVSLWNFSALLSGALESFPKSGERPQNPPTILQITSQIHATLGHSRAPSRGKS